MEHLQDHKVNRYIFLGAILVLAIFLLYSLMAFFTAFLGAIMFYVLSKSPVEWLVSRCNWRRSWAALLVIITSFFIILVPISLLGAMMYQKISLIAVNFTAVAEPLSHIDELLQEKFHFTLLSDKNIAQLQTLVTNFVSSALNQGLNLFSAIIMMYFFLYFMITNAGKMEAAIVFYLPFKRSQIAMFGAELRAQTMSNAVGVPLIAVVQGIVAYIAFLITGMNEPGFWAVVSGFASVIPIVGTGLVWVPAGIYMLVIGQTWQGVFLLIWGSVILSSMDNVVRFLLAKKMADVHPIVTVLGVIIGLHYFGITGLIFGPLLISYFIILLRIYYQEYQPQKKPQKKTHTQTFNLPFLGKRK
jgi:predicted PurR-regulated permease PerM